MSRASVTLRQADDTTLSYVEKLLEVNDLPSRDVQSKPGCFYVAFAGDEQVGVGGLETRGAAGLLRSLVVEQSERGEGYGAAICEALETRAASDGIETLYLLTTTAPGFFAARGYEEVERTAAPDSIRETTEFDGLCPASAVCMNKPL